MNKFDPPDWTTREVIRQFVRSVIGRDPTPKMVDEVIANWPAISKALMDEEGAEA